MAQSKMLADWRFFTLSIFMLSLMFFGLIAMAQSPCNGLVVMNLTLKSQVWCVPHVYQGNYNGQPINTYPVYYGPNTAYHNYWSPGSISSNQPILELTPAQMSYTGAMFWSGYYEGGPVTITLVGTYTTGSVPYVADGFEVYLFITPSGWSTTNPASNYSIPHILSMTYKIQGSIMFPYAMPSTKYIVVQWDPYWSFGSSYSPPNGGDWNVFVSTGNGSSAPDVVGVVGGIGSGAFEPNPGDLIVIKVTYNPSNNTISGVAYDLNESASTSFSYSLNGYFTPPSPGYYTFGIAAISGGNVANWGIIAVEEEGVQVSTLTGTSATTSFTQSAHITSLTISPTAYIAIGVLVVVIIAAIIVVLFRRK